MKINSKHIIRMKKGKITLFLSGKIENVDLYKNQIKIW